MNHSFGMLGLYVLDVEKATAFYTEFLAVGIISFLRSTTEM